MARSTKYFAAQSGRVGLDGDLIGALDKFERGIYESVLRSAAYAGATTLYNDMKIRVPVDSGKLRDSIYVYFDKLSDTTTFKSYLIGPNKRKAPHWYNVEYGHWRYNRWAGRWLRSKSDSSARGPQAHDLPGALATPKWVPARPYIRPTYEGTMSKAMRDAVSRASEKVKQVMSETSK